MIKLKTKKDKLLYKLDYDDDTKLFSLANGNKVYVTSADFGFIWSFAEELIKHGRTVEVTKTVAELPANRILGVD